MKRTSAQIAYQARKKAERLAGPTTLCGCGCGELIPAINSMGKPARFKLGHYSRTAEAGAGRFDPGQEPWNKRKPYPLMRGNNYAQALKGRPGKKATPEVRAKLSASHKGQVSHMKGKHHTDETKAKLSAALKGRPQHADVVAKKTGANSHMWRGGVATMPYGPEFTRRLKRLIRERDRNKCARCGAKRNPTGKALDIHHIDHDKTYNDPSNLITLCNPCNRYFSLHRDESLAAFPIRRMLLT